MQNGRRGSGARRVIVAEDDDDLRDVLVEALTADGHRVVGTSSGGGALSLALSADGEWAQPDLVLSDVRMAGGDGLALAEMLRAQAPTVPVILLTAFPSLDVLDRARLVGAVAVFSKPFDLVDLRTAVLVFARFPDDDV